MAEVHGSINSVNLPAHICWFVNPPQPLCCSACVLHVGLVRATSLLVFLSFLPADEWPGKALGQFSSLPPKASLPFHFPSVPSQFVKTYKPSFSLFYFFFSLFSPGLSGGLVQMASQGPFHHQGFHSALPLVLFLPLLSLQGAPLGHPVSFMELSALEGGKSEKSNFIILHKNDEISSK